MSDLSQYQAGNSGDISIVDIVRKINSSINYLLRRWIIIVLVAFLGGCAGFAYAYFKKPTYSAVLNFVLEDDKASSGGGGFMGLASQFGFDLGTNAGGIFTGANLFELMKSRTLVQQTLLRPVTIDGNNTTLAEYYIGFMGLRKKWEKAGIDVSKVAFRPNADIRQFSVLENRLMGSISNHIISKVLSITQKDKKTSVMHVTVVSENEIFSKTFAELIVKEVSEFYVETKSKKATLNLDILQKQTDSVRNELNAAITGVALSQDNTYNLNPALNIKRVPSSRRQIDVQANTAMLTQLVQNLELAKVAVRKETPLIQEIDRPVFPLPQSRVSPVISFIMWSVASGALIVAFLIIRAYWLSLTRQSV